MSLILLLLIAYIGLGAVLFFMQPSFTFQPTNETLYNPGNIGLEYENLQLETSDGLTLSAWFVPAKNAEFTVLVCYGNGGNMAHRLDLINILNELGINCLLFDYRGYGNSDGKPAEQGVYIDARTAYDWLINEKMFKPEKIIIYGQSLGGSIAAHLASNVKSQGLIIESGFTSYVDIGRKFYPYMPVRFFARYGFKTSDYLKNVNCPVLIIHSRNDEIIPFQFGLRLYEQAAKEPKEFLEITGSHNEGFLQSGQVYRQGLKNWVQSIPKHRHEMKIVP